jgi:hypothetical protein
MFRKSCLVILAALVLVQCKKDKQVASPSPATVSAHNYFGLTIGSYWIYQSYNVDTLNNAVPVPTLDSIYVRKDSVIRGQTYQVLTGPLYGMFTQSICRRDSSGWLVDERGRAYCDFKGISLIHDTIMDPSMVFTSYEHLNAGTTTRITPAGSFVCLDAHQTIHSITAGYKWPRYRYTDSYYADGVGLVESTAFLFTQPGSLWRKMVRYHIN